MTAAIPRILSGRYRLRRTMKLREAELEEVEPEEVELLAVELIIRCWW